jgi:DNA invertase Pin-like site-specific DNA recombinase
MNKTITNNENKKAVIYCRVSTKEQVDEGNSLVSQERICREYAMKEGYEVVQVFIERGESAKTARRKELQQMLDFCTKKKGVIQAVIAYKVDRISRNLGDYSVIRVRLKNAHVEIKSVTEHFEDTPAGRFMENIIANVGQFDNDVRAERCIGGMREAMYEGRYVWMAPTGYENKKVNNKSTIVPSATAPLITEAFELVATGRYSTEAIRLQMLEKGLVSKRGLPIHRGHFFKLLRNPLYKGTIKKFGETRPGLYEPLVSEELFNRVQNVLKGRINKTKYYVHENPDFPLRRFVRNDDGKQLSGYWSKGKLKKYPYYSFALPNTTIRKEVLEAKFMDFLNQFTFNDEHIVVMKTELIKRFGMRAGKQQKDSEAIQYRIAEINTQIDNLINLQIKGSISESILADRTKKFDIELEELNELLISKTHKEVDVGKLLKFAAKALKDPCLLWSESSLEKRKFFQVFVFPNGVVFSGGKFRTPRICSIFKLKQEIYRDKFFKADSRDSRKNSASKTNMPPSGLKLLEMQEFWEVVLEELSELKLKLN